MAVVRLSAEERRVQLVDAAIRVAARDGLAAATTRRIADEAGVPLATVHYCFATKQELLKGVLTAIVGQLGDGALQELRPGTPVGRLVRDALHGLWAVVEAEPERQQLTYELTQLALRDPQLHDLARWQYAVYERATTRQLTAIADAAAVRWTLPLPVVGRMLLTVVDGVVLGWLVDRDSPRAVDQLDAFADLLVTLAEPA